MDIKHKCGYAIKGLAFIILVVIAVSACTPEDISLTEVENEGAAVAVFSTDTTSLPNLFTLVIPTGQADTATFDFYSNYAFLNDTSETLNDITQAIIVTHGVQRNAEDYFEYMTRTVGTIGMGQHTLIIAPLFKNEGDSDGNDLYWATSDWREGASASAAGAPISSFAVIDALVDALCSSTFPNLTILYMAGHSSGATLVQHYALANVAENRHKQLDFKYIVANNQFFYYPNDERHDEQADAFYTPSGCSSYDVWPYGYKEAVAYLGDQQLCEAVIARQQAIRNTTYFLGSEDKLGSSFQNTECENTLQGSTRVRRGENMLRTIEHFYPDIENHHQIIVSGVAHNGEAMFNSPEFQHYLLTYGQETNTTHTALALQGVMSLNWPGSGNVDGKALHLKALEDIADLSIYGIGTANNGGGTDGKEYSFPPMAVLQGDDILLARDPDAIEGYFGDCMDSFEHVIPSGSAINQNGDDAIELFGGNFVIETFGEIHQDGTGASWEYTNSWAYKDEQGEWQYGGVNCANGSESTQNSDCVYPICE